MRYVYLISLGSNLADTPKERCEQLQIALKLMEDDATSVLAESRYYRTPAFPPGSGPEFVNAAARISSDHPPERFLNHLHAIEARLGRERHARWAARSCDLDLLACEDLVLPNRETVQTWIDLPLEIQKRVAPQQLIVPHPRMQDRGFVLVPLADIAPNWRHPLLNKSIAELLEAIPEGERAEIVEYKPQ